jgi:hypothetical protein
MMSDDDRKVIHFWAAPAFLAAEDTTSPFTNMADAFVVSPGSTTTSHSNGASARALNIQMPVCHMASLPSANSFESKSGVPAPSASVGMVAPFFPISQFAAAKPSGESNVAVLPSADRNSPPVWASAL